jgi:hypothetical protein
MASKITINTGICGFRCVLMPVYVAHEPATLPGRTCVLGYSTPRQRRWLISWPCQSFDRRRSET